MDIKIEKDVPIPRNHGVIRQEMTKMEVGESFLLPEEKKKNVRSVALAIQKETNKEKRFSILKVDKKTGEYRCWRVQ
ncbi:MAG: hypothetical protein DRJ03_01055 [Chloroflexi bacterium]|nr:MAG: hypothetical protein DRJ03_01055 [Chloroflexota bacterium]